MRKIYKDNGLPFYDYEDIRDRGHITQILADRLRQQLLIENKAWAFHQIESPSLIPHDLVSKEYTPEDIYITQDYTLRPETTPASYAYAQYLLEHDESQPPLCVWQLAKSFRRENDQVSANVRLKEFYQLEFQCIFTEDTKNDYQKILTALAQTGGGITGLPVRIVPSDRLPHYSEKTLDIEVKTSHKWLEVCSSSVRTDVPFEWRGRRLKNVEFAFGIDRLIYAAKDNASPDLGHQSAE